METQSKTEIESKLTAFSCSGHPRSSFSSISKESGQMETQSKTEIESKLTAFSCSGHPRASFSSISKESGQMETQSKTEIESKLTDAQMETESTKLTASKTAIVLSK